MSVFYKMKKKTWKSASLKENLEPFNQYFDELVKSQLCFDLANKIAVFYLMPQSSVEMEPAEIKKHIQ